MTWPDNTAEVPPPTPAEIKARAAAIRKTWGRNLKKERRTVWRYYPWQLPVCRQVTTRTELSDED